MNINAAEFLIKEKKYLEKDCDEKIVMPGDILLHKNIYDALTSNNMKINLMSSYSALVKMKNSDSSYIFSSWEIFKLVRNEIQLTGTFKRYIIEKLNSFVVIADYFKSNDEISLYICNQPNRTIGCNVPTNKITAFSKKIVTQDFLKNVLMTIDLKWVHKSCSEIKKILKRNGILMTDEDFISILINELALDLGVKKQFIIRDDASLSFRFSDTTAFKNAMKCQRRSHHLARLLKYTNDFHELKIESNKKIFSIDDIASAFNELYKNQINTDCRDFSIFIEYSKNNKKFREYFFKLNRLKNPTSKEST